MFPNYLFIIHQNEENNCENFLKFQSLDDFTLLCYNVKVNVRIYGQRKFAKGMSNK